MRVPLRGRLRRVRRRRARDMKARGKAANSVQAPRFGLRFVDPRRSGCTARCASFARPRLLFERRSTLGLAVRKGGVSVGGGSVFPWAMMAGKK